MPKKTSGFWKFKSPTQKQRELKKLKQKVKKLKAEVEYIREREKLKNEIRIMKLRRSKFRTVPMKVKFFFKYKPKKSV